MRGGDNRSGSLFSYVDIEARVPQSHPLRGIRELANEALETLAEEFSTLYAATGRPSIPPEKLCLLRNPEADVGVRHAIDALSLS